MLALALAVFFWMAVKKASVKICDQYAALGRQLDIEMTQPDPQLAGFIRPEPFLHGTYRGRAMSISVPGKGLQNTRQIETTLKVEVADQTIQWQMTAKSLLSKIRQRDSVGMEKWTSKTSVFDLAIDVRTNQSERLSRILHETRLEALRLILKDSKSAMYLGNGMMVYTKFGLISDIDERELFKRVTDLFCDLAEVIEGR
ncbi:MAG: hypothetical protein ACSHYA_00095 [Opitutaceae bacterium]